MRKLIRGTVAFLRLLARPFRGTRIEYPESDALKLERERSRRLWGF